MPTEKHSLGGGTYCFGKLTGLHGNGAILRPGHSYDSCANEK
jgi:hypothetical protein